MPFPFSRSVRTRVFSCAAALPLLGGCTEHFDGFEAGFSSNTGFAIAAAPPSGDTISFTIRKQSAAGKDRPLYARPHGAILKIEGYMPVLPLEVSESPDAFTVRVRLPEDLVRTAKSDVTNVVPYHGDLFLPQDTGVVSFTGIEHFVPGTATYHVQLRPVFSGPLTSLAQSAGEFLRGLYAAR